MTDLADSEQDWPLISVVTPCYNHEKYIAQTLKSTLDQDYSRLEYIVIDGGSSDGSPDIIRRHSDRLAYWVSEPDRGQTHAINKGLAKASGDVLAYLNSDDLYLPGALKTVAEAFRKNPDVDVIYGDIRYITEDGRPEERHHGSIEGVADLLDLWRVWWNRRQFVQPEVFWRRRIFERSGPFQEDLHYVMDYEYWLRMAVHGARFMHVPFEVAAFRRTPFQKSTAGAAVAREQLEVLRRYLWNVKLPLSFQDRLRLQADWLYDVKIRRCAQDCVERGNQRLIRWSKLLLSVLKNPKVIASPMLRSRLRLWASDRVCASVRQTSGASCG